MHVVIAGCPRSGTSILGELFGAHPDFKFYFEPAVKHIAELQLHGSEIRRAMKNPIIFPANRQVSLEIRIREIIERRTPGLAFNIEEIETLVPDVQFLWIIRHPLDTVASLIPGLTNDWMHPPRPPDYLELLKQQPHVRAAKYWNWFNSVGYDNLKDRDPFMVRYENLVHSPREIAGGVLRHVQAPWTDEIDEYVSKVTNDPKGYQARHQSVWSRDGHATHVDRWRESLTMEQAKEAWGIVSSTAIRHDYAEPDW